MATVTKSPGLTSISPLSFLNSSIGMKLSDLRPALTTTMLKSTRDDLGGDQFALAHLLPREGFLEQRGEIFHRRIGGGGGGAWGWR